MDNSALNTSGVQPVGGEMGQTDINPDPVPILQDLSDDISTFEHDFVQVAVKHRLGRCVLNDILSVFHKHKVGRFPHDFRSIVKTPRFIETCSLSQGSYHHFGLVKNMLRVLQPFGLKQGDEIKLQFNLRWDCRCIRALKLGFGPFCVNVGWANILPGFF